MIYAFLQGDSVAHKVMANPETLVGAASKWIGTDRFYNIHPNTRFAGTPITAGKIIKRYGK